MHVHITWRGGTYSIVVSMRGSQHVHDLTAERREIWRKKEWKKGKWTMMCRNWLERSKANVYGIVLDLSPVKKSSSPIF